MNFSRRTFIRLISFVTVVVVVLSISSGINMYRYMAAQRKLQASRERALTELGAYLDDIQVKLTKGMYSSGGQMLSDISSELWRSCACAKSSLSVITDANTQSSDIYKFLSQVGEYALCVNEAISSGEDLSDEENQNLEKLREYSGELSEKVNYLIDQEQNGGLDFEKIESTLAREDEGNLYLADEINDTTQVLEDYPTLIYDGPFSDHIDSKESEILKSAREVSRNTAHAAAIDFLGGENTELYFLNETEGNMSTYNFYNASYTVSVTKRGGIVSSVLCSAYAGESTIDGEEAVKIATQFLKNRGYERIKESYYAIYDGVCTINFAYYHKGITYYTDLIKVSVALDDGKITAFDATGYIMNHKERVVPEKTKYTPESAEKLLKDELEVLNSKRVFIPTDWGSEIYAYEYHCKDDEDREVLIYIEPDTGEEADILLLLYSDGGILTK